MMDGAPLLLPVFGSGSTASYISLSPWHVALAAILLLVCAGISLAFKLGMERTLLLAGVRTAGQLALLGLILEWVFRLERWYLVLGLMTVMTVVAGVSAVKRTGRRYRGIWADSILSVGVSSWLITAYAVFVVVPGIQPWYSPQYVIPFLGMLLGNTLTGISLGLGRVTDDLIAQRDRVEMRLCLGGTRWEAAQPVVQQAIRTGMTPIVNAMMVVGLVSLPGMMTGQILSGTNPIDAVKYQIVIMFLIAAVTGTGTVGVVILAYHRLFSKKHQFLYERITKAK